MSSQKRSRRWHEALTILKPQTPDNPFAFKAGWKAHERIQKDFPEAKREEISYFDTEELPFVIGYHPDIYDATAGVVYEIKPEQWFRENPKYCIAQLSGYCHFKQAKGVLILYSSGIYSGMNMKLMPWSELREIAIKSDNLLLEKEREAPL